MLLFKISFIPNHVTPNCKFLQTSQSILLHSASFFSRPDSFNNMLFNDKADFLASLLGFSHKAMQIAFFLLLSPVGKGNEN